MICYLHKFYIEISDLIYIFLKLNNYLFNFYTEVISILKEVSL